MKSRCFHPRYLFRMEYPFTGFGAVRTDKPCAVGGTLPSAVFFHQPP
jgi:hypothetical protein